MKNLVASLNHYAVSLAGARVYYRESWECDYFELAGKNFGRIGKDNEGRLQLTIKGEPEENELLRDQYHSVVPGYYANKVHWNSIYLDGNEFEKEMLEKLIKRSYDLVKKTLSKKLQKEIEMS